MPRQEIEDFVRNIVAEIEAAEAAGAVDDAEAIADHLNANGVTTRKGRSWTGYQPITHHRPDPPPTASGQ